MGLRGGPSLGSWKMSAWWLRSTMWFSMVVVGLSSSHCGTTTHCQEAIKVEDSQNPTHSPPSQIGWVDVMECP